VRFDKKSIKAEQRFILCAAISLTVLNEQSKFFAFIFLNFMTNARIIQK